MDAVVVSRLSSTHRVLAPPALGRFPSAGTATQDPSVVVALRSHHTGHLLAHLVNHTCLRRTAASMEAQTAHYHTAIAARASQNASRALCRT